MRVADCLSGSARQPRPKPPPTSPGAVYSRPRTRPPATPVHDRRRPRANRSRRFPSFPGLSRPNVRIRDCLRTPRAPTGAPTAATKGSFAGVFESFTAQTRQRFVRDARSALRTSGGGFGGTGRFPRAARGAGRGVRVPRCTNGPHYGGSGKFVSPLLHDRPGRGLNKRAARRRGRAACAPHTRPPQNGGEGVPRNLTAELAQRQHETRADYRLSPGGLPQSFSPRGSRPALTRSAAAR